jgi:sugar phosphate permease
MINTSILSIFPLHYVKTGNVASISGVMDFATYLGGGVASFIYGLVIEYFGYTPMFVSWLVISVISVWFIFRINKTE